MTATRARIEEISDLNRLSAKIGEFNSNTQGHLATVGSRLTALIQEAYATYRMMEDKKNEVHRQLESAQSAYQACLSYNESHRDDKNHTARSCECERREVEICKERYQEVCESCEKALRVVREIESERATLEGYVGSFRGRISGSTSSAMSALSGVSWKAEDYVHTKSHVNRVTLPGKPSSAPAPVSRPKEADESTEHTLLLPSGKEKHYTVSNLSLSSWILDDKGKKLARIKKEANQSCLVSGYTPSVKQEIWKDIESIVRHNNITQIRCWIKADQLTFYENIGFSVVRKDADEKGYTICKTI